MLVCVFVGVFMCMPACVQKTVCIVYIVSKSVNWCFTPSQPMQLYQGNFF